MSAVADATTFSVAPRLILHFGGHDGEMSLLDFAIALHQTSSLLLITTGATVGEIIPLEHTVTAGVTEAVGVVLVGPGGATKDETGGGHESSVGWLV